MWEGRAVWGATLAVDLEQVASSQSKLLFLFTVEQVTGPFKKALPICTAWNRELGLGGF